MQKTARMDTARPVIAIVDDDPGVLKGLKRLLETCDFRTELFDSGEAFLNRKDGSTVACIVLDNHLGGMSGIELKRRMTKAGGKTPVILMTALDSPTVRKEASDAGCVDYLRKPFSGHVLIDSIRKAISH